ISPRWTTRSTPSQATTLPKRFVMPRSSSAGTGEVSSPVVGAGVPGTVAGCVTCSSCAAVASAAGDGLGLRLGVDRAVGDLLEHLVDLRLQRGGALHRRADLHGRDGIDTDAERP